jgi:ribose transport system permease protein
MKSRGLTGWILPIVGLLAMIVVGLIQPQFLSAENLVNVIGQSAPLAIFALGQMIPIITRGLDLSQGGVVVAASVVYALVAQQFGTSAGALAALTLGLCAGSLNGLMVGFVGVSPFVVTLGVGSILQGLALTLANGQPVSEVPEGFSSLYYSQLAGVPLPLIVVVVLALFVWLQLEKMTIGRYVYAVGSGPRAAYLAGIPTRWTLVYAYAASGLLTSIGSVLLSSRISSGHPTAGSDVALQAVAAAVIGGISLFGGRGTVQGALAGALFLGLLANALNLLGVSSFLQLIAVGLAIILAVVIDRIRLRGTGDERWH